MANKEPAPAGKLAGQLKSYGFLIAAALGLLTALSPMFGDDGLLALLPMPADLSAVGPPLATVVSLFLLMAIFIAFRGRDRSLVPVVGAVFSFPAAMALISLYLSWVEGGRLRGPDPIVSLMVMVAGIGTLTAAFAFLGATLLQEETPLAESEGGDLGRIEKPQREDVVTPPKTEERSTESLRQLYALCRQAEWEEIRRRTECKHPLGYWRLFHHVAGFVTGDTLRKRRRSVGRAQAWTRLLAIFTRVTSPFLSSEKPVRIYLDLLARQLIEREREKQRVSETLSDAELNDGEILGNIWLRLGIALLQPLEYGLDRMYFDVKREARDMCKLAEALHPKIRHASAQPPGLEQGWQHLGSVSKLHYALSGQVLAERDEPFRRLLETLRSALVKGDVGGAVDPALDFAGEMTAEADSLPVDSAARAFVSDYKARGACAAAAIAASALTEETLAGYAQAMVYLCYGADGHAQLTAVCRLTAEYQELVSPLLAAGQHEPIARGINPGLASLRDKVGEERGEPCSALPKRV